MAFTRFFVPSTFTLNASSLLFSLNGGSMAAKCTTVSTSFKDFFTLALSVISPSKISMPFSFNPVKLA